MPRNASLRADSGALAAHMDVEMGGGVHLASHLTWPSGRSKGEGHAPQHSGEVSDHHGVNTRVFFFSKILFICGLGVGRGKIVQVSMCTSRGSRKQREKYTL